MRVALTRSGGFTGTRVHVEVEDAKLPPDEAEQLRALVSAANFSSSRSSVVSRDEFTYDLLVEGDGRLRTCRTNDTSMSAPTRALVEWLMARSG